MDDISGGIYIPYSLRFVVRFYFFAVSWMNPAKKLFIRINFFVKTIFLHRFYSLTVFFLKVAQ